MSGFRITVLHAFVSVDPDDGHEGVPAFYDAKMNVWMPMVAADEKRLASPREMAKRIAKQTGTPIWVARFSVREDVELIEP